MAFAVTVFLFNMGIIEHLKTDCNIFFQLLTFFTTGGTFLCTDKVVIFYYKRYWH